MFSALRLFPQVREQDLAVLVSTLEEEFSIFREVEGESVPVQDVRNGLHKNGKEGTDLGYRRMH